MSQLITNQLSAPDFRDQRAAAHPFWEKIRDGLVALSLANACLIGAWYPILDETDFGYFDKAPIARCVILAMGANFLWVALAVWLIIRALRRLRNRWLDLVCHCLLLASFLFPLNFLRVAVFSFTSSQVLLFLKQPAPALGVMALAALLMWQHRRAAFGAAIVLGVFSPLALFVLARITLLTLGVTHLAQPAADPLPPPLSPVRENQPRVVWVIFDETDQRLAFEQRPAGLQLPEFDRFRSESLYATNAYPPANATLISMPGLISGTRISSVFPTNAADLAVTLAGSGQVTVWTRLPSVFGSVRELGFNTALVGWYHPYSRILGHSLNFCRWYPAFGPAQAATFTTAMASQISSLTKTVTIRKLFADACRDSISESLSLITNRNYGLMLLHLPPPHVPGIYDPARDQFTTEAVPTVTGYFNNLVLADRSLGKLRRALDNSSQAANTWIIQSADHSWRKSSLYDGGRDLRVPFLVKAPGEHAPLTYSPEINTVLTHALILAILRGEVAGQQSLVTWLDANRSAQVPAKPTEEVPAGSRSLLPAPDPFR